MAGSSPQKAESNISAYFEKKRHYVKEEVLGTGGMAVVCQCADQYFHRSVAHKTLKPNRRSPAQVEEFLREARVMGQLEHPGIVALHTLVRGDDGVPGIVMNRIQGEPMSARILACAQDPTSWPLAERVAAFARLVEVVGYAHSKGIIHRDLKPSNVMVGGHGDVTLLDWGLAKQKEGTRPDAGGEGTGAKEDTDMYQSLDGSTKGTPLYMSPEAALGRNLQVDERSDIFSLGVIFFELLTCRRMIPGEKAMEILKNAAEGRNNLHLLREAGVPSDLAHVVRKCVEYDPARRYASADGLRQDIYAWQHGHPLSDFRYNLLHFTGKWLRRHWMPSIIFLLLAAIFLALSLSILQLHREVEQEHAGERARLEGTRSEAAALDKALAAGRAGNDGKEAAITAAIREQGNKEEDAKRLDARRAPLLAEVKRLQQEAAQGDALLEKLRGEVAALKASSSERSRSFAEESQELDEEKQELMHQLTLKRAPELGLALQDVDRLQREAGPRAALDRLAQLPREGQGRAAVKLLRGRLEAQVQASRAPPRKARLLAITTDEDELDALREDRRLPAKRWALVLRRGKPAGRVVIAGDGTVVFIPEDRDAGVQFLAPFQAAPRHVVLTEKGSYGLYGERKAFLQPVLDAPPQPLQLPWTPDDMWEEDGTLFVQKGDQRLAFRPPAAGLSWEALPGMKPAAAPQARTPAAAEAKIPLAGGARELGRSPSGAAALVVSTFSGVSSFQVVEAGKAEPVDLPGGVKVVSATCSEDGRWLILDDKGHLRFLRPGQPARPVPLPAPVRRVLGLPANNLALAVTDKEEVRVLLLSTGQDLFSLGAPEDPLADAWEGQDGAVVLATASGRQYLYDGK